MQNCSKNYYKYLDIIRLISCIAVLLYHFNFLKGGYLAVCTFFVLTGYLSCISAFKKDNFSFKEYYINKFKKLYLPLLIVVFITIAIVSFLPNILWLNLKVETTSILLGYNNFWQLSANLDYFARHINSPFMHLWYIGILLQFDLIFPFIYLFLKKIGNKIHKIIPLIITITLSIIGSIYFYYSSINKDIMITYYDTFTRIFSIFYGLSLGFIHTYYKTLVSNKINNTWKKIIFSIYLLLLILLFIFIDSNSKFFAIAMIVTSIISCRLIDYATSINYSDITLIDKIVKSLSGISYEIYLVQYPVIFFFQLVKLNAYIKVPIMILIIILISYLLHFTLNFKNKKHIILKSILCFIISALSIYGAYKYYLAKDYTKEMNLLAEQLSQNEKEFQEKQAQFESQYKQKEEDLKNALNNLEKSEQELKELVTNLQVVGVGDSVMLGALNNLYKKFPNGYFDAKKSRTAWVVNDILKELNKKNILGEPIIINMGANGDCPDYVKEMIMKTAKDRKVFWVNVANNLNSYVNKNLEKLAQKYDNLYIVDWNTISSGHSEYFIADKIHLSESGRKAYTSAIYDSIYNVYLNEFETKKEELIKEHENEKKNKISFYGNNILLNAYSYLQKDYSQDKFIIDNNFTYESLKTNITNSIKNNTLTTKLVFVFDDNFSISINEYLELIELCKNYKIYVILTSKNNYDELLSINKNNLIIIDFYKELQNNSDYFMLDQIHLSELGNNALKELLKSNLK